MLDVFGVGRQAEKLRLPGRNRRGLVRSGERNRRLGDLYLERGRRAAQHRWRDKGVDDCDVGDISKVLVEQQQVCFGLPDIA